MDFCMQLFVLESVYFEIRGRPSSFFNLPRRAQVEKFYFLTSTFRNFYFRHTGPELRPLVEGDRRIGSLVLEG